ncbi:MAG: hypothetical protein ACPGYK_02360 [Flavobacteriales bacterium]
MMGLETVRNVLLVSLLLGLAWVLLKRMAYAMRKGEVIDGVVELSGTGASIVDGCLHIEAELPSDGVSHLEISVEGTDPKKHWIIHAGPAKGGRQYWDWSLPHSETGSILELHIKAPRSKVIRRIQI